MEYRRSNDEGDDAGGDGGHRPPETPVQSARTSYYYGEEEDYHRCYSDRDCHDVEFGDSGGDGRSSPHVGRPPRARMMLQRTEQPLLPSSLPLSSSSSPHGVDDFPSMSLDVRSPRSALQKKRRHHGGHKLAAGEDDDPLMMVRASSGSGDTSVTESETEESASSMDVAMVVDGGCSDGDQGDDEREGDLLAAAKTPSRPRSYRRSRAGAGAGAGGAGARFGAALSPRSSPPPSGAGAVVPPRSPQTPHSCPEYYRSPPDLYLHCDDYDGAAVHEFPIYENEEEEEEEEEEEGQHYQDAVLGGQNDGHVAPPPRRHIHWASPSPARRHRHHQHQYQHHQHQNPHHRLGRRDRLRGRSPLPNVITTKTAAAALERPALIARSFSGGGGGRSMPSLLTTFLALSAGTFLLAQSYIVAVHHRLFVPPGYGTDYGVPLGTDVPFGPRDVRRALEEERGKIRREILRYGRAAKAAKAAAAARSVGRGGGGGGELAAGAAVAGNYDNDEDAAGGMKFDVRLSPRSGRADLLRTAEETLRQCPSVGEIDVDFNADEAERHNAFQRAQAPAVSGGPPVLEARSDAVLMLADDLAFTCEELDRAFAVWSANPDRIVGFFPQRNANTALSSSSSSSASHGSFSYSAVSDRAVIVHRSVVESLAHRVAAAEAERVAASEEDDDEGYGRGRCRSLALSAAASSATSLPPAAIAARPLRLREGSPSGEDEDDRLNDDDRDGYYYDAGPCLSRLARALGVDGGLPSEETVFLGGSA